MTEVLLFTLAMLVLAGPTNTFDIQAELQGDYDEISQATLQFVTPSDVDMFHDVLYTPDWVFVDPAGHTQTWPQARERAIQALSAPPPDSMRQSIQKLSVVSDGVMVIVNMTIVRSVVDAEGRYGRQGVSHMLTESTTFRDKWVKVGGAWLQKSREQIGGPTVSADKSARAPRTHLTNAAAFDRRCIPPGGVAPSSHIADILGRRALPAGCLAGLGAAPHL